MKLRWSEEYGGSAKQYNDALRVYEVQHKRIDHAYMDRWADSLGIRTIYEQLKSEADPI